jgi:hypothetical protein
MPPSELVGQCEVAVIMDNSIQGLVDADIKNLGSLQKCNADKRSIVDFYNQQQKIWEAK